MKTQVMKAWATLFCLFIFLTAYAAENETNPDKLNGVWEYSLPDAPYGYQEGTLEFLQKDGKQAGVAKIEGSTYNINEIKKEGDFYTCNLYVDGNDVKVKIKSGKDKMEGTVIAGGWEMPVTLKPVKK